MIDDPIVKEVRRYRQAYARSFDYDVGSIIADMKRQTRRYGARVVPCPIRSADRAVEPNDSGGAARARRACLSARNRPRKSA